MIIGYLALVGGAFAIAFTEMTLKSNKVTFPGLSLLNSGQLLPFLIGHFTFIIAIVGAAKRLV